MLVLSDRPTLGLEPTTVAALIGAGGQILGGAMQPGPDPNAAILRVINERENRKATLTYVALGLGALVIVGGLAVLRRR